MKKSIISLMLIVLSLSAVAQNSLKGTWMSSSKSEIGLTVWDSKTFSHNRAGDVEEKIIMEANVNLMGIKVTGAYEVTFRGTYKLDGKTLTINWDPESFVAENTEPLDVASPGMMAAMVQGQAMNIVKTMLSGIEEHLKETDVYTDVKFKKGKMTITGKDQRGANQRQTLTYVSEK